MRSGDDFFHLFMQSFSLSSLYSYSRVRLKRLERWAGASDLGNPYKSRCKSPPCGVGVAIGIGIDLISRGLSPHLKSRPIPIPIPIPIPTPIWLQCYKSWLSERIVMVSKARACG